MTKSAEIAEGIEVCSYCELPIDSESAKHCTCGFVQRQEQKTPEAVDSDEWSDIT